MVRTSGRILKSDDVKLEGQYHLDAAQVEFAGGQPQQRSAVLTAPKVRISENHPEYAVIEVTCSCGTKMYLRCEYAGARAPENAQTQNGATDVPDQTQ